MTETTRSELDEDAIRQALARLHDALRARDAGAFAAACTEDLLVFDLAPPLRRSGAAEEARQLARWLAKWQGPVEDELHGLRIECDGDVAFANALSRLDATALDGERMELWSRVTFGLRREGGTWRVAHRHASVPFHMDGSLRAAVDLTP
jgi:ketosteroid isomerase-like protein